MKFKLFIFSLAFVPQTLFARGGDAIRTNAPVLALALDARDGTEEHLQTAYLEKEIDYFLDLEAPRSNIARDLFNLRDAGRLIQRGDYSTAESRIRGLSKFKNEQTYLMGTLAAAQGRYPQALEYFRQLIDKRTELSENLSGLAFMGAARVFHELGDYKAAIYHYTQIRPLDPQFFQAVFEKSWSFYLNGDMNGSLGVTLSFVSPYFEKAFFPEAFIVRIASFYQLCFFERATQVVEKFKKDYEPLRAQMNQLLSRGVETWLLDEKALKAVNPRVIAALVMDRDFRATLRAYQALKNEVPLVHGSHAAFGKQVLNFVKNKLLIEGKRALEKSEKILRDVLAQVDLIQIDILQSGANLLMGQAPEKSVDVKILDLGDVDFDEMVQFWPFKKEFWLDELGSYYYGLKSNCESDE